MDYAKEINELRGKISLDQSESVTDKFELYHREVRNELSLKREQVTLLKQEVQAVNLKLFERNQELENVKSLLKESEFNLKLALKKSSSMEEQFKEINESYTNLKMKEEMKIREMQFLNETIQRKAQENLQLHCEIGELKDKLTYSQAFQDELEERQMKINAIITKIKENYEQLEKEQQKVSQMHKEMQSADELKTLTQMLVERNEKLKKENTELENSLVKSVAKYEKLSSLIQGQNRTNSQQNILEKIKFLQWESHHKKLQEKNLRNEEIISNLTETINAEVEANALLLLKNEEYETRIEEMRKNANNLKVKIKEDPFDVTD